MPETLTDLDAPRVWIGCLACYNAGDLTGDWHDADVADLVTPEDLHSKPTDHEELWVMDHDNFLGLIEGECSPSHAAEMAELLAEIPASERQPFAVWFSTYAADDADPAAAVEEFRDAFMGEWDSEADFARERADVQMSDEEKQLTTSWPFNAINWDYASQELFSCGYDSEAAPGGGIYVFYIG
ncbi:antirestriction protein ArdA [Kitasatospora sp. NPDC048343]|uniref:antirestriction protein ArdA n=1 Tax=Kitasatospora sp. NPDC048343 TaxID=3154717 RepID=UPI0033CE25B1